MHICFVCSEYPPAPHGGIGSFTQTLGRALVERGHRVTAIGLYPEEHAGTAEDQGVVVSRMSRRGLPFVRFWVNRLRLSAALRQLHQVHPIDIVEGGELDLCALNRDVPGVKVLRMHGGPSFFAASRQPPRVNVWKERWAFHIADRICAVSHCVAENTRRLLHLGDRPIDVIPNPIDVDLFTPPAQSMEEEGLIIFTGTVTERKGIRQLLQAMPRIVAEVPAAHLEIYGGDEIFAQKGVSFTRQLAESLPSSLAGRVYWKGRVPRLSLPAVLQRASVCAYPSHMEALPIGWLEGLAAGKAVVASQTGPGPEIIDHGATGLLCNPHDPDSIAEQIIRILKDPVLRRCLGLAARKIAVERYSLHRLVDRNIEYYRNASSKPARMGY